MKFPDVKAVMSNSLCVRAGVQLKILSRAVASLEEVGQSDRTGY